MIILNEDLQISSFIFERFLYFRQRFDLYISVIRAHNTIRLTSRDIYILYLDESLSKSVSKRPRELFNSEHPFFIYLSA